MPTSLVTDSKAENKTNQQPPTHKTFIFVKKKNSSCKGLKELRILIL